MSREVIFNDFSENKVKMFVELTYFEIIKTDSRYDFTISVNEIAKRFGVPFRMKHGKINRISRLRIHGSEILDYDMFERKVEYSVKMIISFDVQDKKTALDSIVASLGYLVSIHGNNSNDKKGVALAKLISDGKSSKKYTVAINEYKEIMKITNEFFDIRHNEQKNNAKDKREALVDSSFIEYLYNRIYAYVALIRRNSGDEGLV